MTKRIAIAVTAAAAFLFSFSVGVAAGQQRTAPATTAVWTDSCPSPLVMHSDGTCWP
jgi:hypothetical protein